MDAPVRHRLRHLGARRRHRARRLHGRARAGRGARGTIPAARDATRAHLRACWKSASPPAPSSSCPRCCGSRTSHCRACSAGSQPRRTATMRAPLSSICSAPSSRWRCPPRSWAPRCPMLARYAVAEEAQIGRRIGLLYAMNTAGAVAGALLTAFVLLPELGLTRTIWVGGRAQRPSCSCWRSRWRGACLTRSRPRDIRTTRRRAPPAPRRIRRYSFTAISGTGVGTAADAARRRRRVLPGSVVDPHAGARRRQQHLRVRRHGRELPRRHRAGWRARCAARAQRASAPRWRWPSR